MPTLKLGSVTAMTESGGVVTLDGATTFPAGHVLNIQQATRTATSATTSNSVTQVPDLTVTMTNIKSTSSKFLILAHINTSSNTGSNAGGAFYIYRGGSVVSGATGDAASNRTCCASQGAVGGSPWRMMVRDFSYLDSPSSVADQTYAIYWRCADTGGGTLLNYAYDDGDSHDRVRGYSSIIVMEVA